MKNLKNFGIFFMISFFMISFAPSLVYSQDMKARIAQINSEGEILDKSDDLYFTIFNRITASFQNDGWEDEITEIKVIRVVPADDIVNWYWYIQCKTKNTSSPFYVGYDPHNTNLGTYFIFDSYPSEFIEFYEAKQKYEQSIDPRTIYSEALEKANIYKQGLYNQINYEWKKLLYALFDSVEVWSQKFPEKLYIDGNPIDQKFIYNYYMDYNNQINNSLFYAMRTVYDNQSMERTGSEGFIFIKDYMIREKVREEGLDNTRSWIVEKLKSKADEAYDPSLNGIILNFEMVYDEFRKYFSSLEAPLENRVIKEPKKELTRDQKYLQSLGR
jgi:hypothetical protein